jgi:DNA-binding NarL/FixJ family response regulator
MTVLDPAVSERWDDMIRSPPSSTSALLTLRERQIVALVGEGLSNRAIATHLGLSVRTVEGHMSRVFAKVGLATRTELVRLALADDLAQSGSSELD